MAMGDTFAEWVILELMGHRRLAGWLSEQEIAGAPFLRLDVPAAIDGFTATQFYCPEAVYAITPTTEETARQVATLNRPEPVHRWELPALPAPSSPERVPWEPDPDMAPPPFEVDAGCNPRGACEAGDSCRVHDYEAAAGITRQRNEEAAAVADSVLGADG
jgi:hypothetical protein